MLILLASASLTHVTTSFLTPHPLPLALPLRVWQVPKADVLGPLGVGFKLAMTTLDSGRIGIAAQVPFD